MSTDDPTRYAPPLEFRIPLGTLVDTSAGPSLASPTTPVPAPYAVSGAGPGLSTGAIAPPIAPPTVPDLSDPAQVALLFARFAGEHLTGASVVPTPTAAQMMTGTSVTAPGSPGIAPTLVPGNMTTPGSDPTSVGSTIVPTATAQAIPASLVPATSSIDPATAATSPTASGGLPTGTYDGGLSTSPGRMPANAASPANAAAPTIAGAPVSMPNAPSSPFNAPIDLSGVAMPGLTPSANGAPVVLVPTATPYGAPIDLSGLAMPSSPELAPTTPGVAAAPDATTIPAGGVPATATSTSATEVARTPLPAAKPPAIADQAPDVPHMPSTSSTYSSGKTIGAPATSLAPALPVVPPATPAVDIPGSSIVPSSSPFAAPVDFAGMIANPTHLSYPVITEPSTDPLGAVAKLSATDSYYLPSDALGLEATPHIESYERGMKVSDDKVVRDLGGTGFDPYTVRKDFPILEERVHGGKRLVWLDNAATTQKPRAVIDRISYFYEHENSNVHRAAHTLAARSTDAFERARESARRFLNAPSVKEIIWARGATEGINLIAKSWGNRYIQRGDEIVITNLEHHANIVPWQMLCQEKGARLKVAPVDDRGDVILEAYERLMGPNTKLVAIPQVSNALGTITPTKQMVEIAHRYGAHVLVDGAQAVSHMKVDVQALGCEWYVFSGHKVFAPTGIGVVWGKQEVLDASPPWQGGGNMIEDVRFENTRYQPPPWRFEAGTGSIGDAVGLGAAIEYVERIGMETIDHYEHELLVYATECLAKVPGLTMIGTSKTKAGVMSFVLDGQRTEDVSAILDKDGIAVRSGHHCAQPILRRFGLEATVRASLAFYNVKEDIDALVESLLRLQAGRS